MLVGTNSSHSIGTSSSRGMAARVAGACFAAATFLAFGLFYGPAAPAHADPTTVTDDLGVIAAFSGATSTASTIKLGNDITVDQSLTLDAGEVLVIDLDGHTLTVNGSNGTSGGAGNDGSDGANPGDDGGDGGNGSPGEPGGDGGNASHGADGTGANVNGGDGGNGGNAGDGGDGSAGLTNHGTLVLINGSVTAYGANGGNGGDGGSGGNGGDGADNYPDSSAGGGGGDGGAGGAGGDGGIGVFSDGILAWIDGAALAGYGGKGGAGGSAGAGGAGGSGVGGEGGGVDGDPGTGGASGVAGAPGVDYDLPLTSLGLEAPDADDSHGVYANAPTVGAATSALALVLPGWPARAGYTFDGWFDAATGGTKAEDGDPVGLDQTLYAHWTADYVVTFDSAGGSAVPSGSASPGSTIGTAPTSTRTGYTLNGWYTAASGGTAWDFAKDTVAGDLTLYAHWTAIPYTVTFDSAGGSAVGPVIVDFDATIPGPPTSTLAGYTLDGWFTAASGGTAWDFAKDTVAGDVTLYAHWTINTYTVTFHDGDSSATVGAQHGSHVTKPPDPSRDGFGFAGWYANPADIAQWDFETGVVTGDLDLYAKWLPVTKPTGGAPSGTSTAGGGQPAGSTAGADATSDAASEATAGTTSATTGAGAAPTSGATSAAATGPTSELGVGSAGQQESLGYTGTNVVRVALLGLMLLLAGAGGLLLFRRRRA